MMHCFVVGLFYGILAWVGAYPNYLYSFQNKIVSMLFKFSDENVSYNKILEKNLLTINKKFILQSLLTEYEILNENVKHSKNYKNKEFKYSKKRKYWDKDLTATRKVINLDYQANLKN